LADFTRMPANDGVVLETSVASESTITSDAPAAHFARHGAERRRPSAVVRVFINLSLIDRPHHRLRRRLVDVSAKLLSAS